MRRLAVWGGAALVAAFVLRLAAHRALSVMLTWAGAWLVATALVMLAGSKFGKFRLRDALLARIPWRGDEHVLDVGCGHGLLLIGAAKRLTTGRAIGIDIWSQVDQADNKPERTLENAGIEGVTARVEVRDGDARALDFPDATFDVVVSSLALHNIAGDREREQAVREIVRVLRPGGRVAIVDIWRISQYRRVLRAAGMDEVRLSAPSFWFVVPTFLLSAVKPTR